MFGDVRRYAGQFEVGAVDHGAFAAAFLRTHQVLEALAVQAAAVVFLACSGKRGGGRGVVMGWERHSRKNGMMEGKEKKGKAGDEGETREMEVRERKRHEMLDWLQSRIHHRLTAAQ